MSLAMRDCDGAGIRTRFGAKRKQSRRLEFLRRFLLRGVVVCSAIARGQIQVFEVRRQFVDGLLRQTDAGRARVSRDDGCPDAIGGGGWHCIDSCP